MTGAGGIGKQKPPVKEKCTNSLNATLANYRGLPFAVCCSRPYIVYQTVKKIAFLPYCVCRGDHWSPVNLPRQHIFRDSFLTTHRLTGNNGCASEKLYQLCDATVVPEYRDLVRRFLDVPTLAERLKNEEYISTEYRMCDGSWHSLRFVAKKRDEAGNVTHALCTVRCRAV